MSAFNTVTSADEERCHRCGSLIHRRVQYKYGETWQYDYAVGDRIRWGGNDYGKPARRAVALGHPEPCPFCGLEVDGVYDVLICDDVIASVTPGRTEPYLRSGDTGYLILDP
jgi:hypothetical protein